MSDHTLAFVPLSAGYVQSMDLFARGRKVDTGLLAEALIYFDRLLINVENPDQFSQLFSLLIQQGLSVADIIALFDDGTFNVYDFAFTTHPYVTFQQARSIHINDLVHVQDPIMVEQNSFPKSWNLRLNELPAVEIDTQIVDAATLPLSTAAQANKYLWASERQNCDLYLARPISALVGDKLFEVAEITTPSKLKPQNIIESLRVKVEFPDIRRYVNADRIDFPHVLRIRKKLNGFVSGFSRRVIVSGIL